MMTAILPAERLVLFEVADETLVKFDLLIFNGLGEDLDTGVRPVPYRRGASRALHRNQEFISS
jgi:hypothetical protein